MGRPKQLLPLGDRPLLQHVLDQAASSCLDEVVLVLGHKAQEISEAVELPSGRVVRVVINEDYTRGQSSSLHVGLRSTDSRAVAAAIILGDQPDVTGRLIDRAAEVFGNARLPVVRPVYSRVGSGPVPGHPVLLARRIWPEVEKLGGDQGARFLISAHPEWLFEFPVDGDPPADIDNWEDYQRAVDPVRSVGISESGRS
jgi:molybdenum cofactor cytidylyltransferase